MKLKQFVISGAVAAAALAAPLANAAFVIGSASSTGFFRSGASGGLPTSLVSTLSAFDTAGPMTVGSTSGDLTAPIGTLGTALDFTFLTVPQLMYQFSGFTFEILDWGPVNATAFSCANGQCSDGIGFSGVGSVTGNGFQATEFTMSWSAQGSCNEDQAQRGQCGTNPTASWSASISATGVEPLRIPEPATLALVGVALLGVGFSSRRRA
jgi:PEP-CTERM motif